MYDLSRPDIEAIEARAGKWSGFDIARADVLVLCAYARLLESRVERLQSAVDSQMRAAARSAGDVREARERAEAAEAKLKESTQAMLDEANVRLTKG